MKRARTPARRARLAFDPRLAIGVGLIVASVVGVYVLVSTADETIQVYAAPEPLSPGDHVDASDLAVREVRLDQSAELYLRPGAVAPEGIVISRPVGAGELVPASAVGSADSVRMTSLVLDVPGALAASVVPGATVDVWSARESEGRYEAPAVIAGAAIVVRLVTEDSLVAAGGTTAVEVLVPKARVARVLEAIANGDSLSIVPASVPVSNG